MIPRFIHSTSVDQLELTTVADTANLRRDPSVGEALGVADRNILAAPVAVMDVITNRSPHIVRLFQGMFGADARNCRFTLSHGHG